VVGVEVGATAATAIASSSLWHLSPHLHLSLLLLLPSSLEPEGGIEALVSSSEPSGFSKREERRSKKHRGSIDRLLLEEIKSATKGQVFFSSSPSPFILHFTSPSGGRLGRVRALDFDRDT